jgi:carbonic anhydrase
VQDVLGKHRAEIDALKSEPDRHNKLCELNVADQVLNVGNTTVVRDAWGRGESLTIHGWIYDIRDGIIRNLGMSVTSPAQLR